MANPTPSVLLDILTETDRPIVTIDKVPYAMRRNEEMSVMQSHKLRRATRRIFDLMGKMDGDEDLTAEESVELDRLLKQAAEILLDAPPEIHNKLHEKQRLEIVSAFFLLRLNLLPQPAATAAEEARAPETPSPIGASTPLA